MRVSEIAVARAKAGLVISRERRRSIQKMSGSELLNYLVDVYRAGFEDGANLIAEQIPEDEVKKDWEAVLGCIAEVPGVGKVLIERIDEHVRREYEKE